MQEGGSPGLVVMGGDSCSEGRGFKSRHYILDGHCCKNCNDVCLKKPKINEKRGRCWPIFKISMWVQVLRFTFYLFMRYLCLSDTLHQCDQKKLPNVYKSCPIMISLEKLQILIPLQKLPKNVGDLDKLIVAKGFQKLPKVQKITQSGHTDRQVHESFKTF